MTHISMPAASPWTLQQLTLALPPVVNNSHWVKPAADWFPYHLPRQPEGNCPNTRSFYVSLFNDFQYHSGTQFYRQIDEARLSLEIYCARFYLLGNKHALIASSIVTAGLTALGEDPINDLTRRILSHPSYETLERARKSRWETEMSCARAVKLLADRLSPSSLGAANEIDTHHQALNRLLEELANRDRALTALQRKWVADWT